MYLLVTMRWSELHCYCLRARFQGDCNNTHSASSPIHLKGGVNGEMLSNKTGSKKRHKSHVIPLTRVCSRPQLGAINGNKADNRMEKEQPTNAGSKHKLPDGNLCSLTGQISPK